MITRSCKNLSLALCYFPRVSRGRKSLFLASESGEVLLYLAYFVKVVIEKIILEQFRSCFSRVIN